MTIGEIIKSNRILHNLNQTELANMINVSQSLISKWESGENYPFDHINELISVLHIFNYELEPFVSAKENADELEIAIMDAKNITIKEKLTILTVYGFFKERDSVFNGIAYKLNISLR